MLCFSKPLEAMSESDELTQNAAIYMNDKTIYHTKKKKKKKRQEECKINWEYGKIFQITVKEKSSNK